MTTYYLSLGANLGDRANTIKNALIKIAALDNTKISAVSSLYETAPWGKLDQPPFLNLACTVETSLAPLELLAATQAVEQTLGRVRHEHWGARTIDIDLLFSPTETSDTAELKLPHPYIKERAFVLVPLAEIAPDAVLDGKPISYWQKNCPDKGKVSRKRFTAMPHSKGADTTATVP